MSNLPVLLKRARKSRGLTQLQVAELMKTNQPNYNRLELGKVDMTYSMILRFCEAIDISIQEFFQLEDIEPKK